MALDEITAGTPQADEVRARSQTAVPKGPESRNATTFISPYTIEFLISETAREAGGVEFAAR